MVTSGTLRFEMMKVPILQECPHQPKLLAHLQLSNLVAHSVSQISHIGCKGLHRAASLVFEVNLALSAVSSLTVLEALTAASQASTSEGTSFLPHFSVHSESPHLMKSL